MLTRVARPAAMCVIGLEEEVADKKSRDDKAMCRLRISSCVHLLAWVRSTTRLVTGEVHPRPFGKVGKRILGLVPSWGEPALETRATTRPITRDTGCIVA